jgi:hypothetical protein
MKPEDIKKYKDRRPFVPFRIFLNDGRTADITHPDYLYLSVPFIRIATEVDPRTKMALETILTGAENVVRLDYLEPMPEKT